MASRGHEWRTARTLGRDQVEDDPGEGDAEGPLDQRLPPDRRAAAAPRTGPRTSAARRRPAADRGPSLTPSPAPSPVGHGRRRPSASGQARRRRPSRCWPPEVALESRLHPVHGVADGQPGVLVHHDERAAVAAPVAGPRADAASCSSSARSPCRTGRSAPRIRSVPWICSSKTRSQPSSDSRRTPRASPRPAMIDWTRATERALPWPLAAGISARAPPARGSGRWRPAAGWTWPG